MEPALSRLPGGRGGKAFGEAVARQSRYFNAHPYLASVAVGALVRAELDGAAPALIERFRTALCGPLGSLGDRLVWAGWLPFCSLAALIAFGLGAGPLLVVLLFLILYNSGHVALRLWGFRIGWRYGTNVASALGNPVLQMGPVVIGRIAAVATGVALPLALARVIGPGRVLLEIVLVSVLLGSALLVQASRRVEGWRLTLGLLTLIVLYSVLR
jgi:PTS system mannose-specific IID component